jgi:peptidoglycan hydrolase-like protein with peptidoglycan-binding domain
MTTVRTTPQNTSNVRSGRTARTLVGLSVAALTAFAPVAGVVDAAPSALLQQEGDDQEGDDAADGAPSVELGDRNELAAWWQDRLNEWLQLSGSELYPIPVDGWYGPMTQEATIAFQESTEAVEADGVVDPEDRVALREAINSLRSGAPPVELGDRNELAAWWQDRLNEWLLMSGSERYPIVVDGWYGPNTQEATIEFQESTEAVEADGVVDPEDRVALREAIDSLLEDGAAPVELGDRNELAAWWQDRLNEWLLLSGSELYPIVVDGWYGPNTQEATIEFQESTDAVEADGVVDPEDRVALREAIETLGGDTDDGTDGTDGFGTASVTSDDFPASGDVSLLQDVSVEQATDQEATDRLVFEFGSDTGDLSYEVEYTDTLVDTAGTAVEVEGMRCSPSG